MSLLALESFGVLSKAFSACCAALHPHCYYYGLEGGASVPSQRLDPSSQNNGLLTFDSALRHHIFQFASTLPDILCLSKKMASLSPSLRRSALLADELECSCKHLCANKANIICEQLHAHLRLACGCFLQSRHDDGGTSTSLPHDHIAQPRPQIVDFQDCVCPPFVCAHCFAVASAISTMWGAFLLCRHCWTLKVNPPNRSLPVLRNFCGQCCSLAPFPTHTNCGCEAAAFPADFNCEESITFVCQKLVYIFHAIAACQPGSRQLGNRPVSRSPPYPMADTTEEVRGMLKIDC